MAPMRNGYLCSQPRFYPHLASSWARQTALSTAYTSRSDPHSPVHLAARAGLCQIGNGSIPIVAPRIRGSAQSGFIRGRVERQRKRLTSVARPRINLQISMRNSCGRLTQGAIFYDSVIIEVRPNHHRRPDRVRAHVFLCMLAYYVEWQMRQVLKPILFDDHDKASADAARESIVAKAERSDAAEAKVATKRTDDGLPVHGFRSLLGDLATVTRTREPRRSPHRARRSGGCAACRVDNEKRCELHFPPSPCPWASLSVSGVRRSHNGRRVPGRSY